MAIFFPGQSIDMYVQMNSGYKDTAYVIKANDIYIHIYLANNNHNCYRIEKAFMVSYVNCYNSIWISDTCRGILKLYSPFFFFQFFF